MTLLMLREWLASLEASGVAVDEEILVDCSSDTETTTFMRDVARGRS